MTTSDKVVRRKPCPRCTPSDVSHGCWRVAVDDEGNPLWVCAGCGLTEPRQRRKSAKRKRAEETIKRLLGES